MNGYKWWIVAFLPIFLTVAAALGAAAAPLMVEKNLFAPDRKPPSPDAADANKGPSKPGLSPKAIQLDAIMSVGESRKAVIRAKVPGAGPVQQEKGKGQSLYTTVQEGDSVGEYRVVKIESKSISLDKAGETIVVGIFAEGKVVPPPPPTPVAAAASGGAAGTAGGAAGAAGPAGQEAGRARGKVPMPGTPPVMAGQPGGSGLPEGASPGGQPEIINPVRTPYPPAEGGDTPEGAPEVPAMGETDEGVEMEEGAE